MPTLDWIGKKAVVNHHREVPYRLIHCDKDKSVGDPDAGNLLVQGDNLEALKALLPYYAGKVKCIYIDPPYNTGNEGWVYNDNVNSPEIKAWLGSVVGKEAEDLSRHDKWLCMMYPRLRLLKEFLSEDGVIFISIDDNEAARLTIVLDEIFRCRIASFIWKRRQTPDSRNVNGASEDHEYVLCYGRTYQPALKGAAKDTDKYRNPDDDPRGPWMSDNLTGLADATERPNLHYPVTNEQSGITYPPHKTRGWAVGPERMATLIRDRQILWPKSLTGRPRIKRFLADLKSETTGLSTFIEASANIAGTREINEMFGSKVFAFPKPRDLIEALIEQVAGPGDYILDSFAGTGTTGHAVLGLEAKLRRDRKFILIEMDTEIAANVTSARLSKAVLGYKPASGKSAVEGLGSGFRFCTLGEPLFDADGNVSPAVTFPDLAAHVFFCETGSPIPRRADGSTPLIGAFQGRAIYLLHNADAVGVASANAGNVLTGGALDALPLPEPGFAGARIVYGEGCTVPDERLSRLGVTFKQIPYQIEGL